MNAIRKATKGIGFPLLFVAIVAIIGAVVWANNGPTTTTTKECHNLDYSGGLWSAAVSPDGERVLFATSDSEDGTLTITDVDLAYACKASLTPWDEENSRTLIADESNGSADPLPYCAVVIYVGDLVDGRPIFYCEVID